MTAHRSPSMTHRCFRQLKWVLISLYLHHICMHHNTAATSTRTRPLPLAEALVTAEKVSSTSCVMQVPMSQAAQAEHSG